MFLIVCDRESKRESLYVGLWCDRESACVFVCVCGRERPHKCRQESPLHQQLQQRELSAWPNQFRQGGQVPSTHAPPGAEEV